MTIRSTMIVLGAAMALATASMVPADAGARMGGAPRMHSMGGIHHSSGPKGSMRYNMGTRHGMPNGMGPGHHTTGMGPGPKGGMPPGHSKPPMHTTGGDHTKPPHNGGDQKKPPKHAHKGDQKNHPTPTPTTPTQTQNQTQNQTQQSTNTNTNTNTNTANACGGGCNPTSTASATGGNTGPITNTVTGGAVNVNVEAASNASGLSNIAAFGNLVAPFAGGINTGVNVATVVQPDEPIYAPAPACRWGVNARTGECNPPRRSRHGYVPPPQVNSCITATVTPLPGNKQKICKVQ